MRRGKKILIVAVLTAVVLGGVLGGVALAADNGNTDTTPGATIGNFLDKVIGIYETNTGTTIDREALQEAITEARDQVKLEARDQMRQRLLDQGMTEEEVDAWFAWLDARPEVTPQLGPGNGPMPGQFGMRGFRGQGGGMGAWCQPEATTQ